MKYYTCEWLPVVLDKSVYFEWMQVSCETNIIPRGTGRQDKKGHFIVQICVEVEDEAAFAEFDKYLRSKIDITDWSEISRAKWLEGPPMFISGVEIAIYINGFVKINAAF